MESVLNQGENGKHLWQQINWFSEQDGAHSTQISNKLSIDKTWAYREVYRYTGYQLHELKEENGTYYTEDGTDIKTVIREEVWKDPIFPYEAKRGLCTGCLWLYSGSGRVGLAKCAGYGVIYWILICWFT